MRLKEMVSFFDYARNAGLVSPNTVHNWLGAISAISQCLNDEERTVEFVQRYPDVVRERLANSKRDVNHRTMDAYRARAGAAIGSFLSWKADPVKWEREIQMKPRKPIITRPRRPHSPHPEKAKAPAAPSTNVSPAGTTGEARPTRNTVRIPTEAGETVRLEFPDGVGMSDVLRVAWALAVHARDFDPEQCLKCFGKPQALREGSALKKIMSLSSDSH